MKSPDRIFVALVLLFTCIGTLIGVHTVHAKMEKQLKANDQIYFQGDAAKLKFDESKTYFVENTMTIDSEKNIALSCSNNKVYFFPFKKIDTLNDNEANWFLKFILSHLSQAWDGDCSGMPIGMQRFLDHETPKK